MEYSGYIVDMKEITDIKVNKRLNKVEVLYYYIYRGTVSYANVNSVDNRSVDNRSINTVDNRSIVYRSVV